MDDTISRQAAIRWVKANCNPYGKPTLDYESGKKVIEHLEQMPSAEPEVLACGEGELSAQPEQRWIPVTERLPEPRIDVWCNSDLGQMVGYYEEHVETWYGRDYLELMVTAWMPLPEPYREEGEQDE